jgi:RsiW-degrading membrane proteinase PrsW (M82 family)
MTASQNNEVVILLHKPALREKLFFFFSGILSSIPLTLFINQFANSLLETLPTFYALLVSAVVLAPFIEEFAKAYLLFYRHGETERSIFKLGFLLGLGFGLFEFLTYILVLEASILARVPAILLHPMSTSIVAYGLAKKRTCRFFLLAVAVHFSFNFSAIFFPILPNLGVMAILLTTFFLFWRFYNKTSEKFTAQL